MYNNKEINETILMSLYTIIVEYFSHSVEDTRKIANLFASKLKAGDVVYFIGELGVGKTCFISYIIKYISNDDSKVIKSPTFTIVEEYDEIAIYHLDLYRINSPKELIYMGIEEYFNKNYIIFIEWAEKGEGVIPLPKYKIDIGYVNNLQDERKIIIKEYN